MTRRRRAALGLATGLVLWLAVVSAAAAHAIVLASVPAAGEATASPPPYLVLRFNGRIEKGLSSATLVGPKSTTILLLRQESAPPETLIYRLPSLNPGHYQAKWKVLSADGHITEGVVTFTSAPSASPQ